MSDITLKEAIHQCADVTGSLQSAYWLTEAVTGYSSTEVVLYPDRRLTAMQSAILSEAIERLRGSEPLQYVIGRWSFRGIELICDSRALIPRPETEIVVEAAMEKIESAVERMQGDSLLLADLGTGSGAIALSMASEVIERYTGISISLMATDISCDALELARDNLEFVARSLPRVTEVTSLMRGSWYDALPLEARGGFSVVVSNPPYLSCDQWNGLDTMVKDYEPDIALVAGNSGLEHYRRLIYGAPQWLLPDGCIVLEIDPSQADIVSGMATEAGFQDVRVKEDMCGRPRVLVACNVFN